MWRESSLRWVPIKNLLGLFQVCHVECSSCFPINSVKKTERNDAIKKSIHYTHTYILINQYQLSTQCCLAALSVYYAEQSFSSMCIILTNGIGLDQVLFIASVTCIPHEAFLENIVIFTIKLEILQQLSQQIQLVLYRRWKDGLASIWWRHLANRGKKFS